MFSWFRKRKIDSAVKNNKCSHAFHSFDEIRTALIIFDYRDAFEIYDIAKDLKSKGKTVILWTFKLDDTENMAMSVGIRVLTKLDMSKWNILKAETLAEFNKLEYDTLINFSKLDKNDIFTYLLSLNKAGLSIGIEDQKARKLFNLIVLRETDKNMWDTYEQILFYLSKIKSR